MQNRFLNSQAINFQPIQHSSAAGRMAGQAISEIGGNIGNAIEKYAKAKKEKEEKQQKQDAVIAYLTGKGMSKEEATAFAKSGGDIDTHIKAINADTNFEQAKAQGQYYKNQSDELGLQKSAAEAKLVAAQKKEAANLAFIKQIGAMKTGGSHEVEGNAFGDDLGRSTGVKNTPGVPTAATKRQVYQLGGMTGADPELIKSIAGQAPDDPIEAQTSVVNGKVVMQIGNTVHNLGESQANKLDKLESGEITELTIQGKKVKVRSWGAGKFTLLDSGEEVYGRETGILGDRPAFPSVNPSVLNQGTSPLSNDSFQYSIRKK